MKLNIVVFACLLFLGAISIVMAQEGGDTALPYNNIAAVSPPAPITALLATDTENDNGHSITLNW
ncbi:MAG: hypothetical protein NTV06_00265, partial [candidate division Zixibacteria bacterium]|nr:hypothetical protein [candidate division Zixibacteria bacterium]